VSAFAAKLDVGLQLWRERPLGAFPYVVIDARYEKVRHGGLLVDCATFVAMGIGPDGKRTILGVSVALSEAEVHWRAFLTSLVERGPHAVRFIVSDAHADLAAARHAVFPSVPWQRCQFHLSVDSSSKRRSAITSIWSFTRIESDLKRINCDFEAKRIVRSATSTASDSSITSP